MEGAKGAVNGNAANRTHQGAQVCAQGDSEEADVSKAAIEQKHLFYGRIRFHAMVVAAAYVLLLFSFLFIFKDGRFPLLVAIFLAGALGGVISNYLRISAIPSIQANSVNPEDIRNAVMQLYISPLIAGSFGFVLHGCFASQLLQGALFPTFTDTEAPYNGIIELFTDVRPAQNFDAAKSLVWALVAGFAEKLVPNILDRLSVEARREPSQQL